MANFGPIQIPADFSNLTTLQDVVRFLSAFTSKMVGNFNASISTRDVFGSVGATGVILDGVNFGASFFATGVYWIEVQPKFSSLPVVVATPVNTVAYLWSSGVTNTGFFLNAANTSAVAANSPFHFHAKGSR